jgi:hypothetical protein
MIWFHFVRRFVFWQSISQSVNRADWKALTDPGSPEGDPLPSR